MLDNHNGSNEQDILSAFESHLSDEEPQEPTEEVSEAEDLNEEVEEEVEEAEEVEETEEAEATEEGEESDIEEVEESEALYEVTINGETEQRTLDELRAGYQKGADYTQKTQGVAAQKKQLEETEAKLSAAISEMQELIKQQEKTIDWDDLLDNDTPEYLRQKELQERRVKALQKAQTEKADLDRAKIQEETQKLSQKMTTWSDPKQRDQDIAGVMSYLSELGFEEGEFKNTDHRIVLALLDAVKYKQSQTKTDAVVKKVKKAPKVTKPGAKLTKSELSAKQRKENLERFKKSGKESDGIEVFKAFV